MEVEKGFGDYGVLCEEGGFVGGVGVGAGGGCADGFDAGEVVGVCVFGLSIAISIASILP